jgi:stringent starvation protein B
MAETSTKPYMIRALYEWCCDNGYTPYLAVAVDSHTIVPRQHVKGGEIVLNVSPMATSRLNIGNEVVEFQARFSGVAQQISIPIGNISAIYARETGHGMAFDVSKAMTPQEQA